MKFKYLASGAVVASLSLSPISPMANPARADSGDVVAGLIVGAIIGGAVANENAKKKSKGKAKAKTKSTKSKAKASTPAISAEQKAENVSVQESLNHFGWPVGAADGALGPKSKSAIKEYQAFMGYPVTGDLTADQRNVLVTAYHRSMAGGSVISEIVSGSVYGLRGVLIAQAEEMAPGGGTMAAAGPISSEPGVKPGSVAAAAAAAIPSLLPEAEETVAGPAAPITPTAPAAVEPVIPTAPVVTPVTAPVVAPEAAAPIPLPVISAEPAATPAPTPAEEPEAATADATGPGLPTFLGGGDKGTLTATCNSVAMQSSVNGGAVDALTAENAGLALDEQFCAARIEAVAVGTELSAQVQGFTPEQIAQQCDALAPALQEHVAALSSQPAQEVLAGVREFMLASGMSPEQLTGTAKVCLGVGYGSDKSDVALGSALLLIAMGQDGYAELPGWHLARGQADAPRTDLAEGWYEISASAAGNGGGVFGGGDTARAGMLVDAAYALNGHGAVFDQPAALPSFVVEPAAPAVAAPAVVAPSVEAMAAEPAPLPAAPAESAGMTVEGPGADAMRMGAEVFRAALTAPFAAMAQ